MGTNIRQNLTSNNYFIRGVDKIYIDYTENVYLKSYTNCKNLELIYNNTQVNNSLTDIILDNNEILINGILYNSNIKYLGLPRITPLTYFNTGYWKTKNNNLNISDDINDIFIDYPINLLGPNKIIIESGEPQTVISKYKTQILNVFDNQEYELQFEINAPIFNDQENFQVYLIPISSRANRMFCVNNNIIFDKNTIQYNIKFNTSIFFDSRYNFSDNNYFIGLQSNITNKIYLSNPSKYIFITKIKQFKLIDFKLHLNDLSYQTSKKKELLINFTVKGLEENSKFRIKIRELNNMIPIYYSPDILFIGDIIYYQNIVIPENINNNEYTVELEYDNNTICDLISNICVDIDYNTKIHILNIDEISNITINETNASTIKLYFEEKYISSVVNISLNNIFIKNDIITKDNYNNYSFSFIPHGNIFKEGIYNIRVQTSGQNKYFAKSVETIKISSIENNQNLTIKPNFGYKYVSYSAHPNYKTIKSNNKIFIIPEGVSKLYFNIIHNKINYTGKISVKNNSIVTIKSDNKLNFSIDNKSIFNLGLNDEINKEKIEELELTQINQNNSITIDYITDDNYKLYLNNVLDIKKEDFIHIYSANNENGRNIKFYKLTQIEYNENDGYYIIISNKSSFDFTGKIYFYIKLEHILNPIYAGFISITDYPLIFSLNINNNSIKMNTITYAKITINNYSTISDIPIGYFDIYLVNDIYGNSPIYLTKVANSSILDFSFVFANKDIQDKYFMIYARNDKFIINKIINIPIKIIEDETYSITVNEVIEKTTETIAYTSFTNLKATPEVKTIIGVYTIFDQPPNKITPSYFLQQYGLYTYTSVATLGSQYANYSGYLILQTDPLSNSISQSYPTLDSFITYILGQLANKTINVINVPQIFKSSYVTNDFISTTHTFEYYNNIIFNNELINVQSSLCSQVVQNTQLISNITTIKNNFFQSYNDQIRNYNGQNEINNQISTISTLTNSAPRYSWIEDLGHYIGQYFELSINNVTIEKITSDWMNVWNEINLPVEQKDGYNKMIGNIDKLTNFSSNTIPATQIKIPLKFYFNRYKNTGMSIPMISLLHSDVKLTLQLEQLLNLIITDPLTKITSSSRPKLKLYLTYVYLDNEERKLFAQSKHEYLIEQENYRNYFHNGTSFETKINLMQPVKDLFWMAQPLTNIANKQYFNYTQSKFYRLLKNYDRYDEDNPVTELSRKVYKYLYTKFPKIKYISLYNNNAIKKAPLPDYSPINESKLLLNGQKRFDENIEATTLRNFYRYNNIPVSGIHVYPFALYPNEYQPSGSCNFSELGDAFFSLKTNPGQYAIKVIARNYNLLRIMGGQAGLAFEL
jgi:hypothetical protein